MRNLSVRLRITLWFAIALITVVLITFFVLISVSNSVMKKTVRENLVEIVEYNYDEVEFFEEVVTADNDTDHFINYNDGYLEIDDDYLNILNGISTALYTKDGTLLYGENPIAVETEDMIFADGIIQKREVNRTVFYIYDRALSAPGTEGLYLRGVVSEEQGKTQTTSIVSFALIFMPLFVTLAILGGYLFAERALEPVSKLAETAEEITRSKDLKKRIELPAGKDELHKLADSFNGMLDRLDDAFESEKQFTSDVSHELRTPMTVIMAQCELILDGDEERSAAEYKAALEVIKRQGGRMSRLISDMLQFTRLERKAGSYVMENICLSEIFESVCEDMALLQTNGITLKYDIEENIHVKGNRELLSRLITNMISNSYKYGNENGHIEVALCREKGKARLTVTDDGIGIAPDDLDKVFNRFYQADSSRSGGGTGLGLSMVREIASMHGGEAYAESELGKGSVFTFEMACTEEN